MQYKIGIVLSGGGTRGVAHIGVLQALREHGIEPECIAGTSAGALVGALYAAGYSAEEMLEFFARKRPFAVSKFSLAKPGLVDTHKVWDDFHEYFPDDRFEALQRKLFVTATDIVNARQEIVTSGPLVAALLASSAIPMVFTPIQIEGRWFADGGIINNFPIEPLKVLCDAILGVYASPLRTADRIDLKSAWAVSQRAFEVAMYHGSKGKFRECDMLLCPEELGAYGAFDTKRMDEIYEIGYRSAIRRMDAIQRRLEAKLCL